MVTCLTHGNGVGGRGGEGRGGEGRGGEVGCWTQWVGDIGEATRVGEGRVRRCAKSFIYSVSYLRVGPQKPLILSVYSSIDSYVVSITSTSSQKLAAERQELDIGGNAPE